MTQEHKSSRTPAFARPRVARPPFGIRPLALATLLAVSAGVMAQTPAGGAASTQVSEFNVAPGDLRTALDAFIAQSGAQLIYKLDDVKGLTTKGVKGALPAEAAVLRLLEGTRLTVRRGADGAMVVVPGPNGGASLQPAAGEVQALDSVVIMATRRREPVREVPLQVAVLQAEGLERSGAKTLSDYLVGQPGVNLTDSGGLTAAVSIRGVTTGQQTVATVGVYVDDVATGSSGPYSAGAATPLSMGLLDLNHIEILRGPQGTLYGAGAMGGLIKYVTNEPDTDAFSGRVMLGASTTRNGDTGWTTSAVVNAPIKQDVAALRVAAFHDKFGGYVDAVGHAAGKDINGGKTDGARVSLLLTPVKGLSVRLSAMAQNASREGIGLVDLNPATREPTEGDLIRTLGTPEPFTNRTRLYGLDVEYDFGAARLNSITSAQDSSINARIDAGRLVLPLLAAAGMKSESAVAKSTIAQHRISQELRLTSRADRSLEWLAGLYVTRERASTNGGIDAVLVGGAPLTLLATSLPSTYKEAAAYGDITWHATPALALTGGLRLARNSQRYTDSSSGLLTGGASSTNGGSSESSTTYLATAKYALSRTSNVYFRAASGYRPGGPNGLKLNADLSVVKPAFQSDSLWSYELGYKADLPEQHLNVEAAVYDVEWDNIQQPIKSGAFSYYTNGGSARVRGAELALRWTPAKAWHFTATAAAIDSKLTADAPGLQAKAGSRMPVTARFSMTAGAQYEFNVADKAAYAGLTAAYVGTRDSGYPGSAVLPSFKMPGYTLIDLQAGIDFKRFNVAAYVRNLGDRRGIVYPGSSSANLVQVTMTVPRTIGMTVNVPF